MDRIAAGSCLWLTLALSGACSQGLPADAAQAGPVRFAIEISPGLSAPVYVQLNDKEGQPGWITVFRNDERIYLEERCEIEDCGGPRGVCGLSLPMVRNLTAGGGDTFIERSWGGLTSVTDPESGCERRVPAGSGDYVAQLCYSDEVALDGNAPESEGGALGGRVVDPTCVPMPFSVREGEDVVLRVGGS
jgi:hypothetical protein